MIRSVLMALAISGASLPVAAAEVPPALQAMRGAFAEAIAKRDPKAAEFAVFPLANRVYGQPEKLSKAQFLKELRSYSHMKDCLRQEPIVKADTPGPLGSHLIDCNGNLFYFVLRGDQWRYAGYENVNE